MKLQLVMPSPKGRGAGLGNEMIPWAKAIIAGSALGVPALSPAWGLNTRGYRRYFGTSRFDWLAHRALLQSLPRFTFDEKAYQDHGGGSLMQAVRAFAETHRLKKRRRWVLEMDGLWGGLDILSSAKMPLLTALMRTQHTAENLYATDSSIPPNKLRIAMHVRRGDFGASVEPNNYRGKFNIALPMNWYVEVARSLIRIFGDQVHFLIVSDASSHELKSITELTDNFTVTLNQKNSDISDLISIAFSDFIISSISSFSMWGIFFSQARYCWYAPQLSVTGSFRTIWGNEFSQQKIGSATCEAASLASQALSTGKNLRPRGVPVDDYGNLPEELINDLQRTLELKQRYTDLIRYGVV